MGARGGPFLIDRGPAYLVISLEAGNYCLAYVLLILLESDFKYYIEISI